MLSQRQPENNGVTDTQKGTEPISLLVCTRNRPEDLEATLTAMLSQDYLHYELVLFDQSSDERTALFVAPYARKDPRIRYIKSETVGLSVARNLALGAAQHDLCAFTDDDCLVPTDWLSNITRTFSCHPETQILFSPVHVPPEMKHREDLRFPSFYFHEERVLKRGEIFGMGANMAFRKAFWKEVGGFDELLGAGSPFFGAEEHDWLYRAHLQNAVIRLAPHNPIIHYSWRDKILWDKVTRGYATGDAAFAMKHLRCGDLKMIGVLTERWARMGARCLLRILQRNSGYTYELNYFRGYGSGIVKSLRYSVDRKTRLYSPLRHSE